jgi:phospholipid/cholesterol/gamma-HCH transport system ATP-binding protein
MGITPRIARRAPPRGWPGRGGTSDACERWYSSRRQTHRVAGLPIQVTDNLIEIEGLRFSRGDRIIFDGLDLVVPRGRITALMGPSGTGKTTLLRLITGQVKPDSGQVLFDGIDVSNLSTSELYTLRRRMGMLFQNGALLTDEDVFENVAFPLREHTDLPEALIRNIVLTKLQAVGLRGAARLTPAELSGGMARRVALARAMATDPEVLIYDEPFTGLDPISMGMIVRLVRQMNYALGITSIVVSHDVEELSILADASYIIAGGKVAASGSFVELKDHDSEIVHQFINGLADGPVAFHYPAPDYYEDLLAG